MKTLLPTRSTLLLIVLAVAGGVHAQTPSAAPKRPMLQISYMKSAPGKAAEYIKLAREYQLPVHQEVVNQGRLLAWKVYEVRYPNGDTLDYDFVSIMIHPTFADMEAPVYGPAAATTYDKVHGAAKASEMNRKNAEARRFLRYDYCVLAAATAGWTRASHPIVEAIYMKHLPGKAGEMLRLQRGFYLPVYEERIKAGTATGWATTQRRFAPDTEPAYDAISFNAYGSLAQLETQATQAFREKWAAKGAEVSAQLPTLRKRVRAELWRVIAETTPPGQPAKTTE